MRKLALLFIAVLAVAVLPSGVAVAGDDDIIRRGGCSANSDWKLKLSPENGGTEVEYEVDQNRAGQTWHVALKRNGTRIFSGTRVTNERSGSFEVRRVVSRRHGDFTAFAHNAGTGEVCRGRASI